MKDHLYQELYSAVHLEKFHLFNGYSFVIIVVQQQIALLLLLLFPFSSFTFPPPFARLYLLWQSFLGLFQMI